VIEVIGDIAQLVFNVAVVWWTIVQLRINRLTSTRLGILERWWPRPLTGEREQPRGPRATPPDSD